MSCSVESLLSGSGPFQGMPRGTLDLIKTSLYCRWASGIVGPCDAATLLSEASCFQCLTADQLQLVRLALLCQIVVNPPPPVCDLTTSLVAFWKMEEATGASRTDSTGDGNTLADNIGNVTKETGHINFSAGFAGIANQALIGTTNPTTRLAANDTYTLAGWVYLNNTNASGIIRELRPGGQIIFRLNISSAKFNFDFTVAQLTANTFGAIPLATWTFFVVLVNPPAGTVSIRINDSAQDDYAGAPFTNQNVAGNDGFVEIGFDAHAVSEILNGRTDEMRMYKNRLLNSTEQTCLYNLTS